MTPLKNSLAKDRERRVQEARNLQHDERFDAVRTLGARRALVVLGYLLLLAAAALAWASLDGLAGTLTWVVLLAGVLVGFALRRVVRQIVDAPEEALDERQVAVRNAAHHTAYNVVTIVGLGAVMALMLRGEAGQGELEALFIAFALGGFLTPSAVLAWQLPEV